jgi:hypothetical protein
MNSDYLDRHRQTKSNRGGRRRSVGCFRAYPVKTDTHYIPSKRRAMPITPNRLVMIQRRLIGRALIRRFQAEADLYQRSLRLIRFMGFPVVCRCDSWKVG